MFKKLYFGLCLLLAPLTIFGQTLGEQNVFVNGNCGMCKTTIEAAALTGPGVLHANWDGTTSALNLIYDQSTFSLDSTLLLVAMSGYDNEEWNAPGKIYDALPLCCKYRETNDAAQEFHDAYGEVEEEISEIKGIVFSTNDEGVKESLLGVHVYYLGTEAGVVTDDNGVFALPLNGNETNSIIFSYLGFQNDTVLVEGNQWMNVNLNEGVMMQTVEIVHRKRTTAVSMLGAIKIENISQGELEKAACCSLSESFETNSSVDAGQADAVTGTRQIKLLGLASPYVQVTLEGVPYIRGLSAISGFKLVPGSWIQNMQLNTGSGSVSNGFEAMTGQININYRPSKGKEKFFLNLYTNMSGAVESNVVYRPKVSDKVHTSFMLHTQNRNRESDRNDDGFLDNPLTKHVFASNRWDFQLKDNWKSKLIMNASFRDEEAGQFGEGVAEAWKINMNERKYDGILKSGYIIRSMKGTSIGFMSGASYNTQDNAYGNSVYDAKHVNYYSNLLFESQIGSDQHKYRVGVNFQHDDMKEDLYKSVFEPLSFDRNETVFGGFAEYTFKVDSKFTSVLGGRVDNHNKYGVFFTPRVHLRYMPVEGLVFRASAGTGRRSASIFAENPGIFASNRQIFIHGDNPDDAYGLNRELSHNYGGSVSYNWQIGQKEVILSSDFYYTDFQDKVIVDWDTPTEVHFYTLAGKSYSKSFKTQVDFEAFKNFDVRLAYRYNDVQTDYNSGLRQEPLIAQHRVFLNLAYKTKKDWGFDLTINRQGEKRLPFTNTNPEEFQVAVKSPAYFTFTGQVSKKWDRLEIYAGGENMGNFRQDDPIVSAENPWGEFFDASMVWGPVFGSNYYLGLRYTIDSK